MDSSVLPKTQLVSMGMLIARLVLLFYILQMSYYKCQ